MMTLTIDENGFHFSGRSLQPSKEKNALLAPYGKMLHMYGIVLELRPSVEQASYFAKTIGCARLVHNDYLDKRTGAYRDKKETLSVAWYKKEYLPLLKEEKPYLRDADKFALEAACEHVDAAYDNFFGGRARFPRHASRNRPSGNRYTTKQTKGNIGILMDSGIPCVKLPKAGHVPFVLPKGKTLDDVLPPGTRITKATVSRRDGRYSVSLSAECIIDAVENLRQVHADDILAGDAGLKEFLIYGGRDSTVHVENPHFIRVHEKRLRRAQKKLSRRMYNREAHTGSRNWEKARRLVSREQRKTADQLKDFQHKLSRKIADSCTVFICEDLNISGMMKNRHLAKAIASAGWGSFFTKLAYKLERKGGRVLKAGRFFASSQACSCCGYKNTGVKNLSVRRWACPQCGATHDRDENAKDNLWAEGVRMLLSEGYAIAGL